VAQEIERKIYEALGVDPAGSLKVVEPAADAEADAGVEAEPAGGAGAGAEATVPEEQAA
jgi:hypothetical protein